METCKYHPLKPAEFYCDHCHTNTCAACVKEPSKFNRYNEDLVHSCFVCTGEVEKLNPAASTEPFWNRLDKIHLYPVGMSAIAAIIFSALLTIISFKISLILLLIGAAVFYNYCFTCLRSTANGDLEAPSFSESLNANFGVLFAFLGIFILVAILINLADAYLGTLGVLVVTALCIVASPAMFILLAIEESIVSALSIPSIIRIITICGKSYGLLLLFLFILSGSMSYVSSILSPDMDSIGSVIVGIFVSYLVSNYYSIISFHIMGYLVLQNGHELDYTPTNNTDNIKQRSQNKLLEAEAEVLVKEGQYEAARELYARILKANKDNLKYWQKYFALITETKNKKAMNQFLGKYWDKLIELDQDALITNSYLRVHSIYKDYNPKDTEQGLKLAQILYQNAEYTGAVKLLKGLAKHTQDDQHLPAIFALMAKSLHRIPEAKQSAKAYALMARKAAVSV